jgi:hypothetical protein
MSGYDESETAEALSRIATQLKYIEAHGKFVSDAIRDGFAQLAEAIQEQTRAQADVAMGLHAIADAIQVLAETLEPDEVEE